MMVAAALVLAGMWLYLWVARCRLVGLSDFDRVDTGRAPDRWPSVSVVIPARNEAAVLPFALPSVLALYYPQIEVLLVDDCSGDGTAATARQTAESRGATHLRVLAGTAPPAGWRGKLWALQQGVEASTGEWLLFTDADIYYNPGVIRDLMRLARAEKFQMASLMVLLRSETFWDRLLLPSFFFFFHLLYPFHWVRRPGARTAAAAGGCVLVERAALERAGGLAAIREAWIDDVALAGAMKNGGARIYLGATVQAASFRRYGTLGSLREMVVRSAFTQLRYSWALVGATLAALAVAFAVPFGAAFAASAGRLVARPETMDYALDAALGMTLGFMILAYMPALRIYRLPVFWTLTLPVAALLYAAMTVESAWVHTFGGGVRWKGREEKTGE